MHKRLQRRTEFKQRTLIDENEFRIEEISLIRKTMRMNYKSKRAD